MSTAQVLPVQLLVMLVISAVAAWFAVRGWRRLWTSPLSQRRHPMRVHAVYAYLIVAGSAARGVSARDRRA